MGRWLSKIQKSTGQHPPQSPRSPLGGLGGVASGAFEENQTSGSSTSVGYVGGLPGTFEENQAPGPLADIDTSAKAAPCGLQQWVEWIAEQCPLLTDDRAFVAGKLALLPSDGQEIAARRYVKAWLAGADAQPQPVRKENAGRFAANQTLLRVSRRPLPSGGGGKVRQQQSTVTLAPGERMAWHLSIDGKPLVMTGRPMTKEQALESAKARWPGAQVEVMP